MPIRRKGKGRAHVRKKGQTKAPPVQEAAGGIEGQRRADVALANGLAWSMITPPFEVPDENAHYAYVQQIVERGTLPPFALD